MNSISALLFNTTRNAALFTTVAAYKTIAEISTTMLTFIENIWMGQNFLTVVSILLNDKYIPHFKTLSVL